MTGVQTCALPIYECGEALALGYNVAVVFDVKKKQLFPPTWNKHEVVDGDDTDLRFLDPQGGFVIGLRAKGSAKKDSTGFVVTLN